MFIETSAAIKLISQYFKIKMMGLLKEPKNVDLSNKSEPWTEEELSDFRKIMQAVKTKNVKRSERELQFKISKVQPA